MLGLGKIIGNAVSSVTSAVEKLAAQKEMEAVCAAAALLAMADGSLSDQEKAKALEGLSKHPDLKAFSSSELSAKFTEFTDLMSMDMEIATSKLLEKISSFKDDEMAFIRILGIAKQVANAEGGTSQPEQRMLEKIRRLRS